MMVFSFQVAKGGRRRKSTNGGTKKRMEERRRGRRLITGLDGTEEKRRKTKGEEGHPRIDIELIENLQSVLTYKQLVIA